MAGVRRHSANEGRRETRVDSWRQWLVKLPRSRWVAAALLAPAALAATALSGSGNFAAISSAIADPLSVFAERSPGTRAAGALAQSKPARKVVPGPVGLPANSPRRSTPTQGAGAEIGPGIAPSFEAIDLGLPGEETSAEGVDFAPFDTGPFARGRTGTGFAIDGLGGGGIGGGGLVPPSTPGGVPLPDPTNPVSAVPEPQTWLMMMVGFFLLGAALRSRKMARPAAASAPRPTEAGFTRAEARSHP
jgi:hypothetical protein